MNPQDGVSLDLALGVAQFIVLARFVSLLRVTLAVPQLHAEVLRLLAQQDPGARARLRQLSYASPYAEAALSLLEQDSMEDARPKLLDQAEALSRKEAQLNSQRGQNLDLFGILLLSAGLISAPRAWSSEPVALIFGIGTLAVLAATLATRRILNQRLSNALGELRTAVAQRPSLPDDERVCPICGKRALSPCEILVVGRQDEGPLPASRCRSCGAVLSTADLADDDVDASSPEHSVPEASSPLASNPLGSR